VREGRLVPGDRFVVPPEHGQGVGLVAAGDRPQAGRSGGVGVAGRPPRHLQRLGVPGRHQQLMGAVGEDAGQQQQVTGPLRDRLGQTEVLLTPGRIAGDPEAERDAQVRRGQRDVAARPRLAGPERGVDGPVGVTAGGLGVAGEQVGVRGPGQQQGAVGIGRDPPAAERLQGTEGVAPLVGDPARAPGQARVHSGFVESGRLVCPRRRREVARGSQRVAEQQAQWSGQARGRQAGHEVGDVFGLALREHPVALLFEHADPPGVVADPPVGAAGGQRVAVLLVPARGGGQRRADPVRRRPTVSPPDDLGHDRHDTVHRCGGAGNSGGTAGTGEQAQPAQQRHRGRGLPLCQHTAQAGRDRGEVAHEAQQPEGVGR
jgi:hypothetical protein